MINWTLAPLHRRIFGPVLVLLVVAPLVVMAQGRRGSTEVRQAVEYDGNLAFTRLFYGSGLRNFGFGGAAWSHDYPAADKNLSAIMRRVGSLFSYIA